MASLFKAFQMHYRFDVRFTNSNAGNEKGNVENAVGFLRRNLMVPLPHVETMQGLTTVLLDGCDGLLDDDHYRKKEPLRVLLGLDQKAVLPLPGISFDACSWVLRTVDLVGNITVNDVKYFVGSEYAGERVQVGLRAFEIQILGLNKKQIVTHKRVYGAGVKTVRFGEQLLPGLIRKPSSIRNSPIRESLSRELLTYLDDGTHSRRRQFFELFEQATNICGFNKAEQILASIISEGRTLDVSEVEMAARRATEPNRFEEFYDRPDLTVYDQFLGVAQ